jgi:N-hydroxyarylamine O-acetyltransferase
MELDLDAYLSRIGLPRPPRADEEGLRGLHLAHALAIPFENCDVLLRRPILLDVASLSDKLVRRRRGGYCFEQNGLLLAALAALGFTARTLLARVFGPAGPTARTHAVVVATLGGREWLCDVGFGGTSLRAPLPLEPGREDAQLRATYRLRDDAEWGLVLERRGSQGWADEYGISRERVLQADLELGNHYTSTHPASHFTQRFACALQTPGGRVTLSGSTLTRHEGAAIEQRELRTGADLLRALEHELCIAPDEGFAQLAARL